MSCGLKMPSFQLLYLDLEKASERISFVTLTYIFNMSLLMSIQAHPQTDRQNALAMNGCMISSILSFLQRTVGTLSAWVCACSCMHAHSVCLSGISTGVCVRVAFALVCVRVVLALVCA